MEAGMAQKITVALEDDLDGGPADETVRFGLDGAPVRDRPEQEECRGVPPSARTLHRPCPQGWLGTAPPPGRTASSRERSGGIRAWAKDRGIAVSDRGHIPQGVAEQYEAATKGS
jgi:hypothetical protein